MANIIHIDRVNNNVELELLTASRLLALSAANVVQNTDLNSWVTGTSNQITVTDDTDGTITLSLPQSIHTAATPTFGGLTIGSLAGILKGTAGVVAGGATHAELASIDTNQHIDHTGVSVSAGTGMSGGGTIAANRTLNCDITQYTDALARTACIAAAISDGDTTHAPDGNSIFDALALKAPIASPTFTGTVTLPASVIIPNAGYIGSASDTDAVQIEAAGAVVLTQNLGIGTSPSYPLHIVKSNIGSPTIFLLKNSDATDLSSDCRIYLQTGGTGAGDPAVVYDVYGGGGWHVGVDNSDSDSFKIGQGATVGTNPAIIIDTSHNITLSGNITIADGKTIGQSAGPLMRFDDTSNRLWFLGCEGNYIFNGATSTGILFSLGEAFKGMFTLSASEMVFAPWSDHHIPINFQTSGANRITILDGGNVGISDSAPGERLDVTGNANVTGVYKVDDVQVVSNQGLAVADATDAASVITQLNALLARCRDHGLIAT